MDRFFGWEIHLLHGDYLLNQVPLYFANLYYSEDFKTIIKSAEVFIKFSFFDAMYLLSLLENCCKIV